MIAVQSQQFSQQAMLVQPTHSGSGSTVSSNSTPTLANSTGAAHPASSASSDSYEGPGNALCHAAPGSSVNSTDPDSSSEPESYSRPAAHPALLPCFTQLTMPVLTAPHTQAAVSSGNPFY